MKNFYLQEQNGVITLKCRAFDAIPGLRHGFSTRHGGVSEGYLASMSFSYQKENEEIVDENFRRFSAANGLPFDSLVLTHQTHTAHVVTVDESYKNQGRHRKLRETDGLVTAAPGLGLVCFTADCVPLLLADPHARVVAAVHAGWRGTVQGIAAEAVAQMVAAGAEEKEILVAIGPSIGPCCFEVGPEVQREFTRRFGEELPAVPSHREGHTMVDLWQANRLVLQQCGVAENHIFTSEICTFCNNKDYYSHRYTNGMRGSLIGAIAMEEK
ncbi:MAG: peptidoglycan editing factor PgeF [Clostridia bacterium]|nr:peptidoglycan editing factor PgeF [Clostridia bacterium]